MTATYTKLRSGDWGIRGPASLIRAGAEVTVAKKSGERKRERVARVLWTGDGIALAAIERSGRPAARTQSSVRSTYRRRYGWDGVVGSSSYYSSGLYDEES